MLGWTSQFVTHLGPWAFQAIVIDWHQTEISGKDFYWGLCSSTREIAQRKGSFRLNSQRPGKVFKTAKTEKECKLSMQGQGEIHKVGRTGTMGSICFLMHLMSHQHFKSPPRGVIFSIIKREKIGERLALGPTQVQTGLVVTSLHIVKSLLW